MSRENELSLRSIETGSFPPEINNSELGYPTPNEVRMLLRDEELQKEFRNEGYFSPEALIRSLPLYDKVDKERGYQQFLSIVEQKRSRLGRFKHEARATLRRIGTGLFEFDPVNIGRIEPGYFSDKAIYLRRILEARENPFIEIGGPTFGWAYRNSPQPVVMTNLYPHKGVEFIMDGDNMPFPDGSIGAVFGHCVPDYLKEVQRVLEPGGVLFEAGDLPAPFLTVIRRIFIKP